MKFIWLVCHREKERTLSRNNNMRKKKKQRAQTELGNTNMENLTGIICEK